MLQAFEYFQRASQFHQAFRRLPYSQPPDWPRYLLCCHSVELCLKAFLVSRSVDLNSLKSNSLRHNISGLLDRCLKNDLSLDQTLIDDIKCLSQVHVEHLHRYPMYQSNPIVLVDQLEESISKLFDAIQSKVYPC